MKCCNENPETQNLLPETTNVIPGNKYTLNNIVCDVIFYASICVVLVNFIYQFARWDVHGWFKTGVVSVETVGQWSEAFKDENLHTLSRWDGFNASAWREFVAHSYDPLHIPYDRQFRYLEIGVGVGAWSRRFLDVFPNSTGDGLDLEANTVAIAKAILPLARMKVHLANMFSVREIHTNALFNYVFIPGTLCYADNLNQVQRFMEDLITYHIIEIGGKISITMLASDHSETGSCVTRISKAFWKSLKGYTVIDIQEMDSWNLPHALGRYAVFISA